MFEIIPEQEINQSESVHKTSDASSGNESGLFSGIYDFFYRYFFWEKIYNNNFNHIFLASSTISRKALSCKTVTLSSANHQHGGGEDFQQ